MAGTQLDIKIHATDKGRKPGEKSILEHNGKDYSKKEAVYSKYKMHPRCKSRKRRTEKCLLLALAIKWSQQNLLKVVSVK